MKFMLKQGYYVNSLFILLIYIIYMMLCELFTLNTLSSVQVEVHTYLVGVCEGSVVPSRAVVGWSVLVH